MSQHILIVDDSATVRAQLSTVLLGAGFLVMEAADGVEALERIRRSGVSPGGDNVLRSGVSPGGDNDASPPVSLVILDVNMPRKNGIEVLESLHADPQNSSIPVLVLTTEGQPEWIARARELGAKGWMVKPFRPEQLLAAARKLARP
jgi:two-component system chemotaxis response regulator CheY